LKPLQVLAYVRPNEHGFLIPVCLLFLERRYAQELIYRRLWIVGLDLLRVVVFVLDVDIAVFLLVCVLVLEVVPKLVSLSSKTRKRRTYSSSPESCMKSSSSDMIVTRMNNVYGDLSFGGAEAGYGREN